MTKWQFNVLFVVGVGGAVLLLIGGEFGLKVSENPLAYSGVGTILAYVLTQKNSFTKNGNGNGNSNNKDKITKKEEDDDRELG